MSRSANYKSNALIFGLSESKICSANVPDVCQVWFLALFPGLLIAHDTKRPHSRNCLITDVITVSLPYLLFKNSSVWILRRTGNPLAEQVFLTLPPSHCLNHFSWCSGHAWTWPVRSLRFVRSRHTRLWLLPWGSRPNSSYVLSAIACDGRTALWSIGVGSVALPRQTYKLKAECLDLSRLAREKPTINFIWRNVSCCEDPSKDRAGSSGPCPCWAFSWASFCWPLSGLSLCFIGVFSGRWFLISLRLVARSSASPQVLAEVWNSFTWHAWSWNA